MKATEAKPLSAEELQQLQSLLQRWVLAKYPFHNGSSECSDAIQVYCCVERDASKLTDQDSMTYGEFIRSSCEELEL